jgi:hypothetical protein
MTVGAQAAMPQTTTPWLPTQFPRGMAAVADDLHALGLGFGMYSDAGKYTCGGYAGSLGYGHQR